MRIIGIDPGLKVTGYGIIDYQGHHLRLVEAGIITPRPKDAIHEKVYRVYKNLDDVLVQRKPDVLVLEKLYAHYKHPATAAVMGHVRGVICLLCAQHKIQLCEQSVKRIRKSVTGQGSASKGQTQDMVAHVLNIDARKLTPDASDAVALALGYVHIFSKNIDF